jgi:hypothetical protein
MEKFLVTTSIADLPESSIVMVDGTVPGWSAGPDDLHFDHHRRGGSPMQILEIPDNLDLPDSFTFVTTQVDADACAAAAWIILSRLKLTLAEKHGARVELSAIAYDCDHLGLPQGWQWDAYREFAKNAVAAMKLDGDRVIELLELSSDRKTWNAEEKRVYASECFKRGTLILVEAALGHAPYPGELGEAAEYWERVESLRPYVESCAKLIEGCAVFDQRSLQQYCDPRLLVEWARGQEDTRNITLTVRDRALRLIADPTYNELSGNIETSYFLPSVEEEEAASNPTYIYTLEVAEIPAYSYTLGSVPLHEAGSPKFSDNGIWEALHKAECKKRDRFGYPHPSSRWGGRNEVGGSSWNDASVLSPEEVIKCVLSVENAKP